MHFQQNIENCILCRDVSIAGEESTLLLPHWSEKVSMVVKAEHQRGVDSGMHWQQR